MSTGAIGASGVSAQGSVGQSSWTAADGASAVQNFLDYMKETPAERLEDSWLKAHGLTRQELAAMPPAEQKAVMNQMAQDIERQLKQAAENTGKSKTVGS